jgi:hypothetical protein
MARPAGGHGWRLWTAAAVALAALAAVASPGASASTWSALRLPGSAGKVFLLGASCPSSSFCVAVGTNNLIASSTNPGGGAAAWDVVYAGEGPWDNTDSWPTPEISGRQIQAVSCPSRSLCAAVTDQGNIYSSTQPTGPASAWKVTQIDGNGRNTHLEGVSCPTASLCVAVTGGRNDSGRVLTSTDPTGGPGAWQQTQLDETLDLRAVSCGSPTLCVAVGDEGRIVYSTNPRGGAAAWDVIGAPAGPGSLRAISCVLAALCVSGNKSGNLLSSSHPAAGLSSWKEVAGGGSVQITGVSCPSASQCLVVDNNGDVITSTNPTGGAGAWTFDNLLPFTEAEGNALFGASCPSSTLCVLTGARGQIFSSDAPFATDPGPSRRGRARRPRRPRVKIAGVRLPFRNQLRRGRGRVLIRFYARGRVRRFMCRFDHRGPFRRCRSPKRYRVGVGRHVFRVRAIGVTGLRGPVTRERIVIPQLCRKAKLGPTNCLRGG